MTEQPPIPVTGGSSSAGPAAPAKRLNTSARVGFILGLVALLLLCSTGPLAMLLASATAGFIPGLLAFLLLCTGPLAMLLAVVAIVLSAQGLGKAKQAGKGFGLALAGLLLGVLVVALPVIGLLMHYKDDLAHQFNSIWQQRAAGP
jgi:hypothetical protein